MVQTHMLDCDRIGVDTEIVPDPSLGPDGHVAQSNGVMALVEQSLGDNPHRVGEIDEPRTGIGPRRHLLGQLQHDRHGAQRLGQSSRARRLLTETPVPHRQRLVDVARRLAADAQLDDHEVGPLQGGMRVGRRGERPFPTPSSQNTFGEPPDHLAPLIARVEEHEVVDDHPLLNIAEAVHQLGGVGTPAADDNHFGPHATQRNIRPCPSPPITRLPYWPSTEEVPRPTSSSFHDRARSSAGRASDRATINSSAWTAWSPR